MSVSRQMKLFGALNLLNRSIACSAQIQHFPSYSNSKVLQKLFLHGESSVFKAFVIRFFTVPFSSKQDKESTLQMNALKWIVEMFSVSGMFEAQVKIRRCFCISQPISTVPAKLRARPLPKQPWQDPKHVRMALKPPRFVQRSFWKLETVLDEASELFTLECFERSLATDDPSNSYALL